MKLYQKEERTVKNSVEVLDPIVLLEKASKGLLSLSVELGFEILRQLMEEEVTELVGTIKRVAKDTDIVPRTPKWC